MSSHLQIKEYHRPPDLARAVEILSRHGNKARVIAGGTDILPLRPGVKQVDPIDHLVDISNLDLNYINDDDDYIRIGAATPINHIGAFPFFLSEPYRALSEAADGHSTPTIKNRATVGGNLCNSSPCADLALPLLVLDAVVMAAGPGGDREIPIARFFKGANFMALEAGEILQEIRIPRFSKTTGSAFIKLRRQQTAIDMAVVNAAALLTIDNGGCEDVRIALGAVAPVPLRAEKAEALLAGAEINRKAIQKAAAVAVEEVRPISDLRATAAYRRKMVPVLVRRSLESCLQRCGG
jgi:carbon-monoxide dehydrogenase medium subunit